MTRRFRLNRYAVLAVIAQDVGGPWLQILSGHDREHTPGDRLASGLR